MTSTLRVSSANTIRTKPTTGDTKTTFISVDHIGWLKCDGRALDTTQYNLLFQVIGYTFGGSGNTFNLPDPQGRVLGSVGTVTDANSRTRTYIAGDKVGELDHKLTVSEMPSHNHNNSAGSPGANTTAAGFTSSDLTGITVTQTGFAQVSDAGHTHSYVNQPNSVSPAVSLTTTDVADNVNVNQTTGTGFANVSDAGHTHNITDPTHRHQIASNGNDQYHNNIQPTLFYGNLFVYSGIPINGVPFAPKIDHILI
jgi:microcystin-dependent protein